MSVFSLSIPSLQYRSAGYDGRKDIRPLGTDFPQHSGDCKWLLAGRSGAQYVFEISKNSLFWASIIPSSICSPDLDRSIGSSDVQKKMNWDQTRERIVSVEGHEGEPAARDEKNLQLPVCDKITPEVLSTINARVCNQMQFLPTIILTAPRVRHWRQENYNYVPIEKPPEPFNNNNFIVSQVFALNTIAILTIWMVITRCLRVL